MIFNIKITEHSFSPSSKESMRASLSPPARDLLVPEKMLAACVTQQLSRRSCSLFRTFWRRAERKGFLVTWQPTVAWALEGKHK